MLGTVMAIIGWPAEPKVEERYPQPHCVINAIYCAWTWGTFRKDEVRIAVQNIASGVDHAQAEAKINGEWTTLTEIWTGKHTEVRPWTRHYPQEPYRYVGLKDWIAENYKYTNQGGPTIGDD